MTRKGRIAAPARKTLPDLESELAALEMEVWETDWRAKRRAA